MGYSLRDFNLLKCQAATLAILFHPPIFSNIYSDKIPLLSTLYYTKVRSSLSSTLISEIKLAYYQLFRLIFLLFTNTITKIKEKPKQISNKIS